VCIKIPVLANQLSAFGVSSTPAAAAAAVAAAGRRAIFPEKTFISFQEYNVAPILAFLFLFSFFLYCIFFFFFFF
jgi:hypothetical protein